MNQIYLLCNISRQGHFQAIKKQVEQLKKETLYIGLMHHTREIHPEMGLRSMYDLLSPEGIGRDGFIALGLMEGFRVHHVTKQTRTTYSVKCTRYTNLLAGKQFTDVNQIWSSDITYIDLHGKFYYLVMIMDVYSRRIVGYSLADNMRAENNFNALKMALNLRGISDYKEKLIHHSDRGSQYISDAYTQTLDTYGIKISMCDDVYENSHIERLNETIKNQYLRHRIIKNEKELFAQVATDIGTYNTKKPHESIGKISPAEFELQISQIPLEKRKKLEIYTVQKNTFDKNPNQLILFNT